jgi:HEPN domain-containing protein
MRTQPIKLTEAQHKELQDIAKALTSQYKIEKIICFAALNRLSSENSVFAPAKFVSACNYYLLVMTTDITRVEHAIQDYISKLFPGTFVIAHGLETVMKLAYKYDTFFLNTCLNGALIYTADGFTMIPEFEADKSEEAFLKDREAFDRIYNLASGFLESAFICYENDFHDNVTFLLHQSVEQACRALIRLFTGYRSDIHNLERLLQFCNCFSEEPTMLFRRHFVNEHRLFRILTSAYSEARYKDNYQVVDVDADQLCTLVKAFLDLVSELAKKKPHKGTARNAEEAQAVVVDYSPTLPASL